MAETFRDIIDSFPDRQALAEAWSRLVPAPYKVAAQTITLWRHRNSVPPWAWSPLTGAAAELGRADITFERLAAANSEARRQRQERKSAA